MESAPRREAVLGRYELLCLLATGGMASVHLGRATGIGGFEKLLVIKRILPHAAKDQDFIQMFLDEARIAATLDHANVAHVFDVGSAQGDVFLAMEFLHGHDLRSIARRVEGPLPIDPATAIGVAVCAGLHYAHEKRGPDGQLLGLVHRDVSPSNVVVTYDGSVKVIDFGIAKAANRLGETSTGMVKGKPGYMSPEQCVGERELDRRSDVFCVGILLYELTTGTKLFAASGGEYAQLRAIVETDVAPPSSLVPGYPAALEHIVLKALRREPAERYQTALELQRDLEAFALAGRVDVSATRLAAFMESTFRDELQAWRAAEQSGVSLAEYVLSRDQSRRASLARLTTQEGAATQTAPVGAQPRDAPFAPTLAVPSASPGAAGDRAKETGRTALDNPRRREEPTPRVSMRKWWLGAAIAIVVGGGAIAAIASWPHASAPVDAGAVVTPADPLTTARAAEHDGKLELAVARYLEAYDAHADPELLFRIGELYERLDRAADAAIYFQRYLDGAPSAHDRDAVSARIRQLRPAVSITQPVPPAHVTAPIAVPRAPLAHPPGVTCRCKAANTDPRFHGYVLCKRASPPVCLCAAPRSDVGLCPTPLEVCTGTTCTTHFNGTGYNCSDPEMASYHERRTAGAECTGYSVEHPSTAIAGQYACSVCAVFPRPATWKEDVFGYAGADGEPCKGFAPGGDAANGQLTCSPK